MSTAKFIMKIHVINRNNKNNNLCINITLFTLSQKIQKIWTE